MVVAGDELELNLVKEGRDPHQAVGYLPDGTMIVVNHARPHVGRVATVVVSSALQTAGGRLIFAELKENVRVRTRRFSPSCERDRLTQDRPRFALVSLLRLRSYWRAPRPAPARHR